MMNDAHVMGDGGRLRLYGKMSKKAQILSEMRNPMWVAKRNVAIATGLAFSYVLQTRTGVR